MIDYATLLIHRYPVGLKHYGQSYEWRGPSYKPIPVSASAIRDLVGLPQLFTLSNVSNGRWPREMNIGGYPLRLIPDSECEADNFVRDIAMYARVDGMNWFSWAYYASERLARRLFQKTYYRIIVTLSVWNLARIEPGTRPSWRDIGWRKRIN